MINKENIIVAIAILQQIEIIEEQLGRELAEDERVIFLAGFGLARKDIRLIERELLEIPID